MLAKLKNKKHGEKAMALSKQYDADQLEQQVYRAAFSNGLGKLLYWTSIPFFVFIGMIMVADAVFFDASPEKIGMFVRLGVICTVFTGMAYYIFRVGPRRDLIILEEALRIRKERDRGLAHFAAIGEAKRASREEDGLPAED